MRHFFSSSYVANEHSVLVPKRVLEPLKRRVLAGARDGRGINPDRVNLTSFVWMCNEPRVMTPGLAAMLVDLKLAG